MLDEEVLTVKKVWFSNNEWSRLPTCPVNYFALARFLGNLIIVGGKMALDPPYFCSVFPQSLL